MSVPVLVAKQPNCDAELKQMCVKMDQQKMMEMLCEGAEEEGEEDVDG